MYQGFLRFGCTEVANASRAFHQTHKTVGAPKWIKRTYTDTLADAINRGIQYDDMSVKQSPWYDERNPATERFYGVYPLDISGLEDSTAQATLTESLGPGGDISKQRDGSRTVTVKAVLVADGEDALEAGMSWLKAALEPEECGTHGGSCGEMDLQFFAYAPPSAEGWDEATMGSYEDAVTRATRMVHGVKRLSGPTIVQRMWNEQRGTKGAYGYEVRIVFGCRTPYVYTLPRQVTAPMVATQVIQDIPYNLVSRPSAEISGGSLVTARNFSPNPSVEVNTTSWAASLIGAWGNAAVAGSRSDELAAHGTYSFLNKLTCTSAPAGGGSVTLQTDHVVPLPAAVLGERFSFTIWAAALKIDAISGSEISSINVAIYWNDPLNTVTQLGQALTAAEVSGKVYSAKSIQRPTGATSLTIRVTGAATARAGTDLRLYCDAVAVSKP